MVEMVIEEMITREMVSGGGDSCLQAKVAAGLWSLATVWCDVSTRTPGRGRAEDADGLDLMREAARRKTPPMIRVSKRFDARRYTHKTRGRARRLRPTPRDHETDLTRATPQCD